MSDAPKSLDADEIAALSAELAPLLVGSKIQRVHGPAADQLVLHCYGEGEKRALLVVLGGLLPRLHLASSLPDNPERPSEFVMRLRREIEGARIRDLRPQRGERIVTLELDVLEEGEPARKRLEIELLGRRANIVLVGADDRVRALCDASAKRREGLQLARPYEPPPARAQPAAASPPFAWLEASSEEGVAPRSRALEAWASPADREHRASSERDRAASELRKRLKKDRRLLANLESDLDKAGQGEALRRRGELLKAQLGQIAKGQRSIELIDPDSEEAHTVDLPHDQTPVQVMQDLFQRAKKADRALPKLAARVGGASERVETLERFQAKFDADESAEGFEQLREEAIKLGLLPKDSGPGKGAPPQSKKAAPAARRPYRSFRSIDGIEILVGRTSRDNDEVTFRVARGNELWLHAADWPGSHVIIRATGEIPHETLVDAALLAAHFSKAPDGGKTDVSWTHRKHVTKFRGANPGQVQLAQRKTIRVRHDPDRLDRLVNQGPLAN